MAGWHRLKIGRTNATAADRNSGAVNQQGHDQGAA
jgi:hypothetical protein